MLEPAKCSVGCHSRGTGVGAGVVLTELNHHLALGIPVPDDLERGERERGAYMCLPALPDACSPLFSTWPSSLEVFKEGPRSLTDASCPTCRCAAFPSPGPLPMNIQVVSSRLLVQVISQIAVGMQIFTVFPNVTLCKRPEVGLWVKGYMHM